MNRRFDIAGVVLLVCMLLPGVASRVGWRPTWLLVLTLTVAAVTALVLVYSMMQERRAR